MRKLRKLTNGYVYFAIEMFILGVLLLLCAIYVGVKQSFDYLFGILFLYICFIVVAWVLILIYGIVVFSTYKKAKDKLYNISGFQEERFEREVVKAPKIKNVVISSDAIIYTGQTRTIKLIPIEDIVWGYEYAQGRRESLHIWTREKRFFCIDISIKKKFGSREAAGRYLLRLIARKNKGAIIGYDQQYDEMVKKNFNEMLMRTQGQEIISSAALEREYIQNNYYSRDFC